jgi:hypothetical protein
MSIKSTEQISSSSSLVSVKNSNSNESLQKKNDSIILKKSKKPSKFDSGFSKTQQKIQNASNENRLLYSKKLCVIRPELIASLDFNSIKSVDDKIIKDINARMFLNRLSKRKIDLESINLAFKKVLDQNLESFNTAKNQYQASLASASSEIALLKLAYNFKFYAEIGSSFSSFINFYLFDPSEFYQNPVEEEGKGFSYLEFMKDTMQWGSNEYFFNILKDSIAFGKDATMLLQFINDLSFSIAFSTPIYALSEKRFGSNNSSNLANVKSKIISPNTKVLNIFSETKSLSLDQNKIDSAKFCRDLTASVQIGKIIKAKGDEDEKLKLAIEKYSSDFFTLERSEKSSTLYKEIFGWDPYASSYSSETSFYDKEDYYYIPDFSSYQKGLVSNIFTIDQNSLIISTDEDQYQSSEKINENVQNKTFLGVKSLVDKSFSSESGIDLKLYDNAIIKVQDNLEDASYIFKQLFRLLDKKGSKKSKENLAADSHHTSLQNLYAKVIKLVNKRYWTKFTKYLGYNASELLDSKDSNITNSEEFYKCWGIHFISNYPEQSKLIIQRFIEDYNKGFLTFSENSKIEKKTAIVNNQTVEIEVESRDNIFPGTQTPNDLTGKRGSLYSYLQQLESDIRNPKKATVPEKIDTSQGGEDYLVYSTREREFPLIQTASPTNVFCGSLETAQNIKNLETAGFFDLNKGDLVNLTAVNQLGAQVDQRAALLFEWQQCNCMWIKDQDTVYPAGIIPVSACIIDAVMTVLYECLSEIMDIKPAAKSSPYFPSVKSNSPPYHDQLFDTATTRSRNIKYIGGIGSFSSLNTQYWVPVLNAFNESLTRSDQKKSMLFSGNSMSEAISGIINAFNLVCENSNLGIASNFEPFLSQFIADRSVEQTDQPQIPKFGTPLSIKKSEVQNMIDSDLILGLDYNVSGAKIIGDDLNPYTEAILGVPTSFAKNNSPIYSNGKTSKTNSLSFSLPGIYLFATVKNSNLADYKSSSNFNNVLNNPQASPSQLLDQLSSAVIKDITENFINKVEGERSLYNNEGTALEVTPENLIPFYTIKETFLKSYNQAHQYGESQISDPVSNQIAYNISDKISFIDNAYQFSNLSESQAIEYINELWSDVLKLIQISGEKSQIPNEFWLLHNLKGDISTNPIEQLLDSSLNEVRNVLNSVAANGSINQFYGNPWWMNDANFGGNKLIRKYQNLCKVVLEAESEEVRFGIAFDLINKFSERIKRYSETAYEGLVNTSGKPNALEKLMSDLAKTIPGRDILQNLNRHQLSLKTVSLKRLSGDENNFYISKSEILNEKHIESIKLMLNTQNLNGEEGKNIRNNIIGFPSGFFNNVYNQNSNYTGPLSTNLESNSKVSGKYSPLFGIKVNCKLPDYPILSVIPKIFRFDYELFVLPDAFDSVDFNLINCWEDLVKSMTFTRIRFLAQEGTPGTSEEIVKIDAEQKEIFSDLESSSLSSNSEDSEYNASLFDVYSNTLASYLLQKYYKLISGLSLQEEDFNSIFSGLNIPINDYAVDLSKSLSSIYKELNQDLNENKVDEIFIPKKDITALELDAVTPNLIDFNNSIVSYEKIVKTFSKEIKEGKFKDVDISLFDSFTNASSSKLFSAKNMRDQIISAKYFDRIFCVMIDPDEFKIASSFSYEKEIKQGRISIGKVSTPAFNKLLDSYSGYQKFLIDNNLAEIDSEDDNNVLTLKLSKRLDEGKVSFSSTYYNVIRKEEENTPYGITLKEDNPGDLMIIDSIEGDN